MGQALQVMVFPAGIRRAFQDPLKAMLSQAHLQEKNMLLAVVTWSITLLFWSLAW